MRSKGHHLVARESWPILTVLALLAIAGKAYLGYPAATVVILLMLGAGYFFRNPLRQIPAAPLAIVSPASGRVVAVGTAQDPWLTRYSIRTQIKISALDVHTLCSPIEGKVMKEWSDAGGRPRSNRRHSYWIKTDEGDDVIFSLVLDKWSPYVGMMMHAGERVGQGQECGFLYVTGMVEIYAPDNSRMDVKKGDCIDAGTDILGHLVHDNGASVLGA